MRSPKRPSADPATPVLSLRVVRELPHDPKAYTEGLFLDRGRFYESTGLWGKSDLRIVDPATGRVLRRTWLPPNRFGEGIALVRDPLPSVVMLTWKSGQGFIFDAETLELIKTFDFQPEGWGLAAEPDAGASGAPSAAETDPIGAAQKNARPETAARQPAALWQSRGDNVLLRRDPQSLQVSGELPVVDGSIPVSFLNELEIVDGLAVINLWLQERLAVVQLHGPRAGQVLAWIDIFPLRDRLWPGAEEANGVTWDPASGHLLVTGKHWDKLFEIEVQPRPWRRPDPLAPAQQQPEPEG